CTTFIRMESRPRAWFAFYGGCFMAAERSLVCAVVVLATLGCAGVPSPSGGSSIVVGADAERLAARLPVVPCANAVRPEAVGVWQSAGRDNALIYDGCSVR